MNFTPKSSTERFICGGIGCDVSDDLLALYRELGDEAAFEAAEENLVDPIIGRRLMDSLGEDQVPSHWRESYEATKTRISAYMQEVDRMASAFLVEGIPLVALKNAGIARALYTDTGCVPMGDVDMMVRREDFKAAHQVLLNEGYAIAAPNKLEKADVELGYLKGGSEYETTLPDGQPLWFELQWRPVEGRFLRPDQEPKADVLMSRSLEVDGSDVRILSPEDNLLQVALHTAKHSYVRAPGFRLQLDVERIVHTQPIDWSLFVEQVHHYQVTTPVYFSLLMPLALFGTPIPEDVLKEIAPPPWKIDLLARWICKAGIYNPGERKFGRAEFIAFTSFLYDDVSGFWRGVFPDKDWMRQRYKVSHDGMLPYYYTRRILDLAFRRMPS